MSAAWPRSNAEIDRSTLWGWLEPRAKQLARAFWSGNHALPLSDYRSLMRFYALVTVGSPHARGLAEEVRNNAPDIAAEVFERALDDVGTYHAETQQHVRKTAAAALRERMAPKDLAGRVVQAIGNRDPSLPHDLEQEALVSAMRDIRFERLHARKHGGVPS